MEKVKLDLIMDKQNKRLTPLKSIRAKCLDCSSGQTSEVRNCLMPECALYSFRFGKNPQRSGKGKKNVVFTQESFSQQTISQEGSG